MKKMEPEFQIYECSNPACRFRCPTNLSERTLECCPLCGGTLLPQGKPFSNQKRHSDAEAARGHLEVLLDNLRSTLNVGSIFRTADGAGVDHIYCCGTTPTPLHPKIAKTGLGAEGFTPWSYRPNALDLVRQRKQAGVQVIALEAAETAEPLLSLPPMTGGTPALLVVGNEVSGIDPEILAAADHLLFIPMRGQKSSLNVAVAFGIAIYTLQE